MSFFLRYELKRLVADREIQTFHAKEIASGAEVFLHFIKDEPPFRPMVVALRQWLNDPGRREQFGLREIGEFSGQFYVVTNLADNCRDLRVLLSQPDAAPPPNVANGEGAPDGVKHGTETDPLKAQAVSLYRARLEGWFASRFPIKGKIPFERLKDLRASARITVSGERTVAAFSVARPSGDAAFDEQVRAALAAIQSSGAEIPPPPPMYPDILGTSFPVTFACTNRSLCE